MMFLKEYLKHILLLVPLLLFVADMETEQEHRKIVEAFNKYYKKK